MFIDRALRARDDEDPVAFHLWASVSLELLGKASLAHIHPALVADPTQFKSLLSACGHTKTPHVRSITAKTVFERLVTTCQDFDDRMSRECMTMADRRNAELHSGESPVVGLDPRAWVPSFWRAVAVLLPTQGRTLEEWVGSDEAARAQKILDDSAETLAQTVLARIDRRRKEFSKACPPRSAKRRDAEQRARLRRAPPTYSSEEAYDEADCPACGLSAWVFGREWDRDIIDERFEQYSEEDFHFFYLVRVSYAVESFYCDECQLTLDGSEEIEVAGLPEGFERELEEDPEYEPEYGNE